MVPVGWFIFIQENIFSFLFKLSLIVIYISVALKQESFKFLSLIIFYGLLSIAALWITAYTITLKSKTQILVANV